jgi:hypothetical protein
MNHHHHHHSLLLIVPHDPLLCETSIHVKNVTIRALDFFLCFPHHLWYTQSYLVTVKHDTDVGRIFRVNPDDCTYISIYIIVCDIYCQERNQFRHFFEGVWRTRAGSHFVSPAPSVPSIFVSPGMMGGSQRTTSDITYGVYSQNPLLVSSNKKPIGRFL